jgi:hypothetical protein
MTEEKDHFDGKDAVGKVKRVSERIGESALEIEYEASGSTYYPLHRVTDTTMAYIFFSIAAICITSIVMLCIFSFITLPILING